MIHDEGKIFKTADQGIAAYFVLLGNPCIGAIPSEEVFTNHLGQSNAKMEFVFIDVPNPHELALEFKEDKAIGKLRSFQDATKSLRYMLRNPMSREDYEALKS